MNADRDWVGASIRPVPVSVVHRQCARDAIETLRQIVPQSYSQRRQILRSATRTTPRRDYVASTVSSSVDLYQAVQRVQTALANLPARTSKNLIEYVTRTVPRGWTAQIPPEIFGEAEASEWTRWPQELVRASTPPFDVEFEVDSQQGLRLTGVRPWLSTLVGCDAEDERGHRELLRSALQTGFVDPTVEIVFLLPDFDSRLSRVARARIDCLISESDLNASVRVQNELTTTDYRFVLSEEGSLNCLSRQTGRPIYFALATAVNASTWPRWIRQIVSQQDRIRLHLLSMMYSTRRYRHLELTAPEHVAGIEVGRPGILVSEPVTTDLLREACLKVGSSELVTVREAGTDRSFVVDYKNEFNLIADTITRGLANSRGVLLESPPHDMARAMSTGGRYHYETQTVLLPLNANGLPVSTSLTSFSSVAFTAQMGSAIGDAMRYLTRVSPMEVQATLDPGGTVHVVVVMKQSQAHLASSRLVARGFSIHVSGTVPVQFLPPCHTLRMHSFSLVLAATGQRTIVEAVVAHTLGVAEDLTRADLQSVMKALTVTAPKRQVAGRDWRRLKTSIDFRTRTMSSEPRVGRPASLTELSLSAYFGELLNYIRNHGIDHLYCADLVRRTLRLSAISQAGEISGS